MKHSILGMSVLAIVVTLACCSKNDAANDSQGNLVDRKTNQYRTDFEAKYGKVGSTQSWDFSGVSTTTRAAASTTVSNIKDPEFFQNHLHNDMAGLKAGISNAQELDWNPNVSVNLYPAFCYDELMRNQYISLEVNNLVLSTVQIKDNAWWNRQDATAPSQKGKSINTTDMTNPAWTIACYNNKLQLQGRVDIRNYKEVVVNGRTYWCFDYDGNADYVDLIYMVTKRHETTSKRYMVEEPGSTNDFDFNDIVFDVIQDEDGSQTAIIRAMGGTLDFTLTIGNTTWQKSVDGSALGYVTNTMYNTTSPKWNSALAQFKVTGWNPNSNNISVTMVTKESKDAIMTIPFPKTGETPMMIAVKPFVDWQPERTPLPENWWATPEDNEL